MLGGGLWKTPNQGSQRGQLPGLVFKRRFGCLWLFWVPYFYSVNSLRLGVTVHVVRAALSDTSEFGTFLGNAQTGILIVSLINVVCFQKPETLFFLLCPLLHIFSFVRRTWRVRRKEPFGSIGLLGKRHRKGLCTAPTNWWWWREPVELHRLLCS